MRPIGGFFELEILPGNEKYHSGIGLSTGRACLHLAIKHINPQKVYVPFYSCDALYEPIQLLGLEMEYYAINEELEIIDVPTLQEKELLIYTNFFGQKSTYTEWLIQEYGYKVLVDNTHHFFHTGYSNAASFTSARKYFGVPDGAYLYGDFNLKELPQRNDFADVTPNVLRLSGRQEEGYKAYTTYEKTLDSDIKLISLVSEILLSNVKYDEVKKSRKENFQFLHSVLSTFNTFPIHELSESPFCYPFLPLQKIDRQLLYAEKFFIPTLWPDTVKRGIEGYDIEKKFSTDLLPLPIDHRYSPVELERLVSFLHKLLK